MKDILDLGTAVHSYAITGKQLLKSLDTFIREEPCGFARIIWEKSIFPDHIQTQRSRFLNPRDYLFYGSQEFQTQILQFLMPEILQVYPKTKDNFGH